MFRLSFVAGMLLILITNTGFSLTLAKASLGELANESAVIVHGQVVLVEYQWEDENHRAINTFVTIDVDGYLKGSGGSQVVVKQMGGKIGDLTDEIYGTPIFKPGEEVVLFLLEHQGAYHIHSIALGSFHVFVDKENSKRVINDVQNVHLVDPETGKEVLPGDAITAFDFNSFIRQINSFVDQQ